MGRRALWAEDPCGQESPGGRGPLLAGESYGQGSFMGRGALWAGEPYGRGGPMGWGVLWAGRGVMAAVGYSYGCCGLWLLYAVAPYELSLSKRLSSPSCVAMCEGHRSKRGERQRGIFSHR